MIVPLVSESEWLERLEPLAQLAQLAPLGDLPGDLPGGLPFWELPSSRVLVLAPHPDDETLAAGGLIASLRANGVSVRVVAVTDGENAYPHEDGASSSMQRQIREVEQTEALQQLGVDRSEIIRLRLPDSDVAAHEAKLIALLLPLVANTSAASDNSAPPAATHLIAPWHGDFHPDHEACGRAAAQVARLTGATLTSYFFWTWHRGTGHTLETLDRQQLRAFPLSEQALKAKLDALHCHRSQLEHPSGEPILPERLLAPAYRPFEIFLTEKKIEKPATEKYRETVASYAE